MNTRKLNRALERIQGWQPDEHPNRQQRRAQQIHERKGKMQAAAHEGPTDELGRPIIHNTSKHIASLERRMVYVQQQIRDGSGTRGARQFQEDEVSALKAAIQALIYHRGVITGYDEPVRLLAEVVDAYDGPPSAEARLRDAIKRAKGCLQEMAPYLNK